MPQGLVETKEGIMNSMKELITEYNNPSTSSNRHVIICYSYDYLYNRLADEYGIYAADIPELVLNV